MSRSEYASGRHPRLASSQSGRLRLGPAIFGSKATGILTGSATNGTTDTGPARHMKGQFGWRRATRVDSSTTATGKGRAGGSNTTIIGITTAIGEIGIVAAVMTAIMTMI